MAGEPRAGAIGSGKAKATADAGLRARAGLIVVGLAGMGWGLWQLVVVSPSSTRPLAALTWIAGALVVHDGVLAPIAVAVGILAMRWLRPAARRVVAAGLFVAACLVAVALPALLTPGVDGNPSATPRNYGLGLAVALGVDVVATLAGVLAVTHRPGRRPRAR